MKTQILYARIKPKNLLVLEQLGLKFNRSNGACVDAILDAFRNDKKFQEVVKLEKQVFKSPSRGSKRLDKRKEKIQKLLGKKAKETSEKILKKKSKKAAPKKAAPKKKKVVAKKAAPKKKVKAKNAPKRKSQRKSSSNSKRVR